MSTLYSVFSEGLSDCLEYCMSFHILHKILLPTSVSLYIATFCFQSSTIECVPGNTCISQGSIAAITNNPQSSET